MVLQRILHGERLDEFLGADKTQSVLKANTPKRGETVRTNENSDPYASEEDDRDEREMTKNKGEQAGEENVTLMEKHLELRV